MNQKIPFHELAKRLSLATSISNDSAEVFIKIFFDLLSEAIVSGETVKIKGLGSFAPVSIDGENSVEFTPDKGIADTLNAPFAPFEPVELNDEVTDEMLNETTVESQSENVDLTNEQTDDTHIQEVNTVEPAVLPIEEPAHIKQPELQVEPIAAPAPKEEENAEHLSNEVRESQPDTVTTQAQMSVQKPEQPVAPTPESASTDNGNQEELPVPVTGDVPAVAVTIAEKEGTKLPATTAQGSEPTRNALEEEPEEFVEHVANDNSSNNGGFGWGFLVGLIVGLALGACAVYLAIDYLFPYGRMERTEQVADNDAEIILTEEIALPEQTDTTAPLHEEPAPLTESATAVAEPAKDEPELTETKSAATVSAPVHDTVRQGYSLTHMAKKHYGSKDFWVYIYEENKSKIKNPNKVQPGEVFVIPAPEKYGINAASEESVAKAKNKAGQILSKFK